jgi:hypothetical protein
MPLLGINRSEGLRHNHRVILSILVALPHWRRVSPGATWSQFVNNENVIKELQSNDHPI